MKFIMRTTGDRDVSEYPDKIPGLVMSVIEERSAYKNFLNALMLAGDEAAVHLEDDIILCDNFIDRITAIIEAHENEVVQCFSGTRKDDMAVGTRYENGSHFLWAQCFYLPAGMSGDILEFSQTWDKVDGSEPLDCMVADYLKQNGKKYLKICPSLVDHKEGKSLINSKRNPRRVSGNFVKEQTQKTLDITCEGSDLIDYKTIKNLQGSLKTRTMDDIEGMIRSLIQHGFSFPMFIYKHKDVNYTIDGHGRLIALSMMEENGYILNKEGELLIGGDPWVIPPIPCVYIKAKDLNDAKVKLLKLNSEYGVITPAGFADFTKDINPREYEGIPLRINETEAVGEIDPLLSIGEILIPDIGSELVPDDAPPTETDFTPVLDPVIPVTAVTKGEIQKAAEKEHGKKGLDVETMQITCKHCGKVLTVRKSDVNFTINAKIKELSHGN